MRDDSQIDRKAGRINDLQHSNEPAEIARMTKSCHTPDGGDNVSHPNFTTNDPDLARVIAVWDELSDPIKAAIRAIVDSAARG